MIKLWEGTHRTVQRLSSPGRQQNRSLDRHGLQQPACVQRCSATLERIVSVMPAYCTRCFREYKILWYARRKKRAGPRRRRVIGTWTLLGFSEVGQRKRPNRPRRDPPSRIVRDRGRFVKIEEGERKKQAGGSFARTAQKTAEDGGQTIGRCLRRGSMSRPICRQKRILLTVSADAGPRLGLAFPRAD
jgi:hypothetical protein